MKNTWKITLIFVIFECEIRFKIVKKPFPKKRILNFRIRIQLVWMGPNIKLCQDASKSATYTRHLHTHCVYWKCCLHKWSASAESADYVWKKKTTINGVNSSGKLWLMMSWMSVIKNWLSNGWVFCSADFLLKLNWIILFCGLWKNLSRFQLDQIHPLILNCVCFEQFIVSKFFPTFSFFEVHPSCISKNPSVLNR